MTPQYVIQIGREAIYLMLLVSAPMLLAGLVVGIGISILQAVTQIHEVTLTFIPKIIAVTGALVITLPWIMQQIIDFMTRLMMDIPNIAR
ncbi:MAG: EscS/YscS/HrcS family type III secretion system export apparatus protein [Candidatus Handelsmanbacteria bacterium RIFCSPLOWO2_12_FULL_64_10]|uniref:Flagellar biosynthetic protein FliQ n=1 Tax=Handelsmanbacteria sp. (strain RIFCSPLOWO2_12_FULL_64_10) TaxID=1817868 RepID=A0A1F6D2L4_HANXR|nr:flagellar biosynthesis protein FliQ [bacterium]OGG55615.1 MAG: EscS/YscS/HrcS family type III secretion system export apparatus protein [Candidatus Handelsmanbacteria bacterium RIFCSPLOWO2_12_FULL_64_10]